MSKIKEPEVPEEVQPEVCGHINKQFVNKDGKLEDLSCTLLKGHAGDHYAKFMHTVTDYGQKDNRQVAVGTHTEESEGWWSDGARVYANPVEVTAEEDYANLKHSRGRERGVDTDMSEKLDKEIKKAYG